MKKVLLVLGFISFILVGCSYEVDSLETSDSVNSNIIGEYIDVSPDLIDFSNVQRCKAEINHYMKAFARYHAYVDSDGDKLIYKGPNSTDLNISQRLFTHLEQGLKQTNDDIAKGVICLIKENGQYKLISPKSLGKRKKISRVMLKTRGVEADGTPFKPGDLSGSEEEIGESVVNGLKQFFTNVNSEESYYGYIGDYVDLTSRDWSQDGSMIDGYFRFNEQPCYYSVVNLNAGMNDNIGYNELCTSEFVEDNINNVYQIKAIACYQQTSAIVITVYDYDTFQAMRKYLGC